MQRQLGLIQSLPLILEPRGTLPPEVVSSSTAGRVIWTSPSNPNGSVTESSVYVNNKLYKPGMGVPGPFILKGLSPVTICDIQVRTLFCFVLFWMVKLMDVLNKTCQAMSLCAGSLSWLQIIVYLMEKGREKREIDQNESRSL